MTSARSPGEKIDSIMEQASQALVRREYFDAERLCADALQRAHVARDFDRMARILLPLEEARRQKRDMALDSRHVAVAREKLPAGRQLKAGCYLICPPRVGADGRALREAADRRRIPVVVVVREPTTRDGQWPIVALGPVTIRTKVAPPRPENGAGRAVKKPRKASTKPSSAEQPAQAREEAAPPAEWFLRACERLGDAAIASLDQDLDPEAKVEALMMRLAAHPDHEKLHQALAGACRDAARVPPKALARRADAEGEEDDI